VLTRILYVIAALAVLFVLVTAPRAAEKALVDPSRLAFGAGVSYEWHGGDISPAPEHRNELAGNLFGAYSLTQHFTGVARATWGAANGMLRVSPGMHYNLGFGQERFAVGLTYDFYAGDFVPAFPNEWVVSAIYSRPLGKHLTLSVVEGYGFDNHEARTSVQATVPLWVGRED
jgi:hypothetical protein